MTTARNSQVLRTIPLLITICLISLPAQAKYGGGTGEPSEPYGHTVILRVVKVTPDWVPYTDTSGWTQAVTIKESEYLKYFEVAIWEETASIHLYEFPNDYDPHYGYRGNTTDDENIAYREQFALEVFTGLPGTDYRDERSEFIRNAFYSFIDNISDRYAESNHGLTYNGHGGPGGALFAISLAPKHAQDLLLYWTKRAGKKLAFIDMGGPCNKGAYADLSTFCPYCEYYIGSDLNNGGYTFDDWTYEKYLETKPDNRYHDLIANHASLIEVLKARIDIRRTAYEYSRNNMIQNKVEQCQYLYSSANFKEFHDAIEAAGEFYPPYSDLYSFIWEDVYLRDLFNSVIVYKADNRDFFDWEVEANGIITPNTLNGVFSDALLSIEYPVLDFPPELPGQGTYEDPYLIHTTEQIIDVGADPGSWDKHFKLMADIGLFGFAFDAALIAPHGDPCDSGFQGTPFTGVFDGNGHTISHLTIQGGGYLGLFGRLETGAEIKNLGLLDVNITGSDYVGGLVGYNEGDVTGCYSTGTVIGHDDVGGLVGLNGDEGTVTCCYSTGNVSGGSLVAGLVGYNHEGAVTKSYSTGAASGISRVGGLVGWNRDAGAVTDCFWDIQTSGQARSDGGTGKITAEMQTAGTFLDAGWDFVDETANGTEDIWWILEGRDYPRLWWQATEP